MLWEDRGSGNVSVQLISSFGEEDLPERPSAAAAGTNMTSSHTTEQQHKNSLWDRTQQSYSADAL